MRRAGLLLVVPLVWLLAIPLAGQPDPNDVFIHNAFVDLQNNTVTISGVNFDPANVMVRLDNIALMLLGVVTPTQIVAVLSTQVPGNYRLTVTNLNNGGGGKKKKKKSKDHDDFELTIGPQGEPGPPGADGDDGVAGMQGVPGNLALAGQSCTTGQFLVGFDANGDITCDSFAGDMLTVKGNTITRDMSLPSESVFYPIDIGFQPRAIVFLTARASPVNTVGCSVGMAWGGGATENHILIFNSDGGAGNLGSAKGVSIMSVRPDRN